MAKFTLMAKQVKDFFGMVKEFNSETRLHIEPDKIYVNMVDITNIAIIRAEIKVDTKTKKPIEFGLIINKLLAFIKVAKDTDPIEFEIAEHKKSLCIQMSYMDHVGKIRSEDINTIRRDANSCKVSLPYTFLASGERIAEFFKMYPSPNGKFEVILKNKRVSFKTHNENGYMYETFVCNGPSGDAKSVFLSDYLKPAFMRMKKSMITVSMNTDHPIKLSTTENDVAIEILMAPRITAD